MLENGYMEIVPYFKEHMTEYYFSIYVPVMVWMIISVVFIVIMFKKYTFGDWTVDNPNPCDGETFNMPRGTIRGVLTMSLLFITVVIELANARVIGYEQEFPEFMAAFQMMVAFYFGAKVMHHINSVDKSKTKTLADAYEATTTFTQTSSSTTTTKSYNSEAGVQSVGNDYFEEEGAAG